MLVLAIAVVQVLAWLLIGRHSLDDHVYLTFEAENTEAIRREVSPEGWPKYWFVCTELTRELSAETIARSRDRLALVGAEWVTREEVDALGLVDLVTSPSGCRCGSICVVSSVNTPIIGIAEIFMGSGSLLPYQGYSEMHLFLFGRWLRLRRFGYWMT